MSRHAEIGLLDAAKHLLVESVLERLQIRGHRLGVRVFRLEVADHIRVRLLAQPEVVVRDRRSVADFLMRNAFSHRRRGLSEEHQMGGSDQAGGEKADVAHKDE